MLYKVINKTFCVNGKENTELTKGETVQIEKIYRNGKTIIKVYRDKFIGILDDNDAIELDL